MKSMSDLPVVEFTDEDVWATGRFPGLLADFAREHGPIFKRVVDTGPMAGEYVFMVGPEANRFVLHTGREHFSHEQGWTPILGEILGRGLLNMDPPEHTVHRRMWNPAFTNSVMESYIPTMHRIIRERTAGWPARDVVDVYEEMRDITFDAAAAALAGFERGPRTDRLRELFYMLLHGGGEVATIEEWYEMMRPVQDELVPALLERIATRRAQPADAADDVLSRIVHARDDRGRELTDAQILGHLNILLVAGHETTTTLGAWTLYLLANRPEDRDRLRAEVDEVLADEAPIGNASATFSVEALRRMPLVDAFVKETGRLHPPVINVPRGTLSDFEFAGYHVPAGTPVRLSLAAGHLLPDVFAEPKTFDFERFNPERREDRATPYSLVTFGGGPRICIGINFANIEVRALIAHILRHYDFGDVPPQPAQHLGYWTAMVPGGLKLRLANR